MASLETMVARPTAAVRYGPAGWTYRDWSGVVYPRPAPRGFDPLTFLASYFDTIEINSTFYRPVEPKVAAAWARRVEGNPRFRFTAKLSRRFTHERQASFSQAEVRRVRRGFEVLQDLDRLGAVVIQFPWSFRRTEQNREWLRDVVSAFDMLPLVLEVRHESWNTPEFFSTLAERGIGFVNIDQPLFKDSLGPTALATAGVGYIRVHGRNWRQWFARNAATHERYDYFYSAQELVPWAARTRQLAEHPRAREVYVVTNNHYLGKAPANALMLQAMVERTNVAAPPELFHTYEAALRGFAHVEVHTGDGAHSAR